MTNYQSSWMFHKMVNENDHADVKRNKEVIFKSVIES